MRILIRTSKTAMWARRLGSLAVPLLVLSVASHRFGFISTAVFQAVALLTASVALAAVLLSVIAAIRLWISGDHGWRQTFWGAWWGLVCLAPFFWYGHLALRYPMATDVATASRSFLPLTFEPDTAVMPPARTLTRSEQSDVYPNALTRAYPIVPEELYALVLRLIEQRGWDIRFDRAPGEYPGRVNARVIDIFGWRDEVVFGLAATEAGSKIDMRSASIGALHDFGANGKRVEAFLAELDAEVTAFIRDNPNVTQSESAGEGAPVEVETGSI